MKNMSHRVGVGLAIAVASSYFVVAQQPPAPQPPPPPPPMSFFVTSAGSGKGADLGGIAGADRIPRPGTHT